MQKKSLIKQNILRYIDSIGVSAYKFYNETGITRGVLSQDNGMSEENTAKFLAYYKDVNPEWLLTGNGPMLKIDIKNLEVNRKTNDKIIDSQLVPLYNLEATAGLKELFCSKEPNLVLDTIKIPNLPKCDGAITVTGDSMYPLLKSGDTVLYKQVDVDNIFFGEMYLLSVQIDEWEEYVTVKYVQKSENGSDFVKLVSYNPNHQPKDISIKKISAIALIKASIRFNTMN